MGADVPRVIGRHSHPKARPEAAPAPPVTGIDYLGLLADRHAAALAEHVPALAEHVPAIDYRRLVASTGACPGQLTIPTDESDTT